jgi:hypothetical protein
MKPRKRAHSSLLLAASILSLGIALSAGFFALGGFGEGELRRAVLANGTPFTIDAVVTSSEEKVLGQWWQRLLYPHVPAALRDRLGCRVYRGQRDRIDIYATTGSRRTRWIELAAVLSDDRGLVAVQRSAGDGPQGAWSFDRYPRRSRHLHCRIFYRPGSTWLPVTGFEVENPWWGPYPTWKPARLPATQRLGNIQATLLEVKAIRPHGPTWRSPVPILWTRAVLQVTENGRPVDAWRLPQFVAEDAVGNRIPRVYQMRESHGRMTVDFESDLIEDVMKLRFRLDRDPDREPEAGCRATFEDVPLPGPGQAQYLSRTLTLGGRAVRVAGLFGPGAALPKSVGVVGGRGSRIVLAAFPTFGVGNRAVRSGTYDWPAGAAFRISTKAGWQQWLGYDGPGAYTFLPPAGVGTVDLTVVGLHEPTFEFVARRTATPTPEAG